MLAKSLNTLEKNTQPNLSAVSCFKNMPLIGLGEPMLDNIIPWNFSFLPPRREGIYAGFIKFDPHYIDLQQEWHTYNCPQPCDEQYSLRVPSAPLGNGVVDHVTSGRN